MGQLKHEGQAIDVVSPGGSVEIFKGELYRIDGWTGIAMSHVLPTDPELGFALEVSDRIWYIEMPAAVAAARGAVLYWSAGTGFKTGSTDLVATGAIGQFPCVIVEEAKDGNNIVGVRVLNFGASMNAGT